MLRYTAINLLEMSSMPSNSSTYTAYLQGSLCLNSEGIWIHEGTPFSNPRLSELFSRSVVWNPELASYVIKIGHQQALFTIEDVPYFADALVWEGATSGVPKAVQLAGGCSYPFSLEQLRLAKNELFYLDLSVNAGRLDCARCSRSLHQILIQHCVSEHEIQFGGRRFRVKQNKESDDRTRK